MKQNPMERQDRIARAKAYAAGNYRLYFLRLALDLVLAVVFILLVSRPLADLSRGAVGGPYGQVCLYAALAMGMGAVLGLPLSFYAGYLREHRYGLSNQTVKGWLLTRAKGALVGVPLSLMVAVALFWTLRTFPHFWWLVTAGVWLIFLLVLARLAPVLILPLFYKVTPLANEELKSRITGLANEAGLRLSGVFAIDMSKNTTKMNAALTGIGRSRRVLLGDTLLEKMSEDEIAVVFAHEVGHHARRHIPRLIVVQTLGSVAALFVCSLLVGLLLPPLKISPLASLESLPLVAWLLGVIGFFSRPLFLAHSRSLERESDAYALAKTGLAEAFASGMKKLAAENLADESPSRIVELFFFSHPPIAKRIAMARPTETGGYL